MKYAIPRGTRDILPDEIEYWHHIETASRSLFDLYNYCEIRTPIFEESSLFERSIGGTTDIVEKEMYTFNDKGNRRLTLRPEGTAPIVRAYIHHGLHKKSNNTKWYYCGPMFRYERPQAGRYRQFHQIGVEHFGNAHPFSDAEVISMGVHLFDDLGLANLMVVINSVGCKLCRPVIEERLQQFAGSSVNCLCVDCQRRLKTNPLRILDCKKPKCNTYFTGMPDIQASLCNECKDHFNSVLEYLDALRIPFKVDSHLVRGLDYYNRTTFEIVSDELGAQNAICGGGRYDYLVEQMGGSPTPAVGFAFGVERAVLVLQELSDILKKEVSLIYVAPIGFAQQTTCFYLVDELRRSGIKCSIDYSRGDIKSQLRRANKLGASYTIIYAEAEAEKGTMIIKNMKTGQQIEVPVDTIIQFFTNMSKEKSKNENSI
ncbi:MAG: histidine--tRNA ligase [bacterium]|nr:histidine--tRNA ligase [bacterium]